MSDVMLHTPVLLIVFNRPEPTQQVFDAIRKAGPHRLYIAADAARPQKEGEAARCGQVREIVSQVDWDCEVHRLFREENQGCKMGVSGAISWFFEKEEQGIILEDDCVPSPSFFPYCQELLTRYAQDKRVMHIAGTNHHPGYVRDADYSYYFSYYGHMWGWASWRRAWALYDIEMKHFPEILQKGYLYDVFGHKLATRYFIRKVTEAYTGKIDTWDYQWDYSRMVQSGLTIVPHTNLIHNIGFGADATHTFSEANHAAHNLAKEMAFPLRHPPFVVRDARADQHHFKVLLRRILQRKAFSMLGIKGYDSRG